MNSFSRRDLLKTLGSAALVAPLSTNIFGSTPKRRALRVAHMTDFHVMPEKHAGEGMAKAIRHVQGLRDKPDLILSGGDLVMDSNLTDFARTLTQWDLFRRNFRDNTDIPVHHTLGNHDVWGWWDRRTGNPLEEAKAGKKWALEVLGMPRPYHSFDKGGWHFILLDSIHPGPGGKLFMGKLDEEQADWLEKDLQAVPQSQHVFVMSHIPILGVSVFNGAYEDKTNSWTVAGSQMHSDSELIRSLFLKHPNVKVCVSGHIHLLDRVDYNGVTYYCNGAVCGAWWNGSNQNVPPGYAVLNLYSDGTHDREYVPWGWTAA